MVALNSSTQNWLCPVQGFKVVIVVGAGVNRPNMVIRPKHFSQQTAVCP